MANTRAHTYEAGQGSGQGSERGSGQSTEQGPAQTVQPEVQAEVPVQPVQVPGGLSPEVLTAIVQGLIQQQGTQMFQGFQLIADRLHTPFAGGARIGGVREFKGLHPPEFYGSGDPIEADEWFQHVQRLLVSASVPELERVRVAQVQLLGVARAWFDLKFVDCGAGATWAEFQERLYAQFFPEDARSRLVKRFVHLIQGDVRLIRTLTNSTSCAVLVVRLFLLIGTRRGSSWMV